IFGFGSGTGPPGRVLRHANRRLTAAAPPLLREALEGLDAGPSRPLAAHARVTAALALTIHDVFDRACRVSGRAIGDTIFSLHTQLGLSRRAPETPHLRLNALDDFAPWLAERTRPDSPWRPLLSGWIDVYHERLTMHRYPTAMVRRRHARCLIAAPLALLVAEHGGGPPDAEEVEHLEMVAEQALRVWDLEHAEALAVRG